MAKNAPAPDGAAPAKKNSMKLILVAVIGLLLAVGLSVGGTWFFLSRDKPEGEEVATPREAVPVRQPAVYEELVPAFVVNFQGDGRTRYMQVGLTLLARDEAQLKRLTQHMPTLRNQLVLLLSSQDYVDLNSPLGVEMLKQKVTASVQELAIREVGSPVVEQVLFTGFVMQ